MELVIYLVQSANYLHMVQLMLLLPHHLHCIKVLNNLLFLRQLTHVVLKRWLLVTGHVARMYRFCLVCVSVRVTKTDNFITTSHFAFTWGEGLDPFRHVRLSARTWVSVQGFFPI